MTAKRQLRGMRIFFLIWLGQVISLIGSGLTSFALDIWVYQQTESVTQFAIASLCGTLPFILISPLAGPLIDRYNRRLPMILGDLGAGLSTLAIALLLFGGRLEVWHIYLATAAMSCSAAFQVPAYMASIALLVPKESLDRANGMIQMGQAIAQLIAPILGGVLLVTIQLQGIILIDFVTFLAALVTLLSIQFPDVDRSEVSEQPSLWRDGLDAWTYLAARPGLAGLVLFLAGSNFLMGIVSVLATPLVLSFASAAILGSVLSLGGVGMLAGGFMMSTWQGNGRRMTHIFNFTFLSGLAVLAAGLRPSVPLFTVAAFLFFFSIPIIHGCSQAILQQKVKRDVQGRVFALTGAIAGASLPLSFLIAGPLADRVFEPLMAPGTLLAGTVGTLIGVGQGRGIGLLFVIIGVLTMLTTLAASRYPRLQGVEVELPDALVESVD